MYSNGKKTVSKTAGSTALTRDVRVRISPPQPQLKHMKAGIYKITNLINSKVYIGQSRNIEERWKEHIEKGNNQNSEEYNYPLYQAFRKYGIDNFKFEILEECS